MSHKRGQIVKATDCIGNTYYQIFTGCKHLDDYYTCDTLQLAKQIAQELKEKRV